MDKINKDLRYIKTEKLIRKTFHELLQEKDINHITVRELSERAEINKTTFYSHYETLPHLIDTLEKENIDYIMDNLDQVQLLYTDSDMFIDNLYHNLQDCKIVIISKNSVGNQRFVERLKIAISDEIAKQSIDISQYKQTLVLLKFILHGLLGMMNTGKVEDDDIKYVKELVKSGLKSEKI